MPVETPDKQARPSLLVTFLDLFEVVVFATVAAMFLLTFVGRVGFVEGSSMQTTMMEGDTYIVSNLFYTPHRGDIVVFDPPASDDEGYELPPTASKLYVKRVIAVGGDHVQICKNEEGVYEVWLNGEVLDEPYLDSFQITRPRDVEELDVVVPEGHFFAMGDNRIVSLDSRVIGCVDNRRIVGHIICRIAPLRVFGPVD